MARLGAVRHTGDLRQTHHSSSCASASNRSISERSSRDLTAPARVPGSAGDVVEGLSATLGGFGAPCPAPPGRAPSNQTELGAQQWGRLPPEQPRLPPDQCIPCIPAMRRPLEEDLELGMGRDATKASTSRRTCRASRASDASGAPPFACFLEARLSPSVLQERGRVCGCVCVQGGVSWAGAMSSETSASSPQSSHPSHRQVGVPTAIRARGPVLALTRHPSRPTHPSLAFRDDDCLARGPISPLKALLNIGSWSVAPPGGRPLGTAPRPDHCISLRQCKCHPSVVMRAG